MIKQVIVGFALAFCIFSSLAAQSAGPSAGVRPGAFRQNSHPGSGQGRHGFFGPNRRGFDLSFFAHPFLFLPNQFAFHQPFFFPGHLGRGSNRQLADPDAFHFHAGPDSAPFFFGPSYGYNSFAAGPTGSGWHSFVDEWKDRSPGQKEPGTSTGLSQSLLLKEGMSEEEVAQALGSPIQRIRLGGKEIWKYSGYSLLFEGGTLKEMR